MRFLVQAMAFAWLLGIGATPLYTAARRIIVIGATTPIRPTPPTYIGQLQDGYRCALFAVPKTQRVFFKSRRLEKALASAVADFEDTTKARLWIAEGEQSLYDIGPLTVHHRVLEQLCNEVPDDEDSAHVTDIALILAGLQGGKPHIARKSNGRRCLAIVAPVLLSPPPSVHEPSIEGELMLLFGYDYENKYPGVLFHAMVHTKPLEVTPTDSKGFQDDNDRLRFTLERD